MGDDRARRSSTGSAPSSSSRRRGSRTVAVDVLMSLGETYLAAGDDDTGPRPVRAGSRPRRRAGDTALAGVRASIHRRRLPVPPPAGRGPRSTSSVPWTCRVARRTRRSRRERCADVGEAYDAPGRARAARPGTSTRRWRSAGPPGIAWERRGRSSAWRGRRVGLDDLERRAQARRALAGGGRVAAHRGREPRPARLLLRLRAPLPRAPHGRAHAAAQGITRGGAWRPRPSRPASGHGRDRCSTAWPRPGSTFGRGSTPIC